MRVFYLLPLVSGVAYAQTETAAAVADIEEIVVTGSAIRSGNDGRERPVSVLSETEIAHQGAVSIQQIFQKIPFVSFQGLTSNQNSGRTGNNFVDMRNLGPARTLVLIDGKRMVPTSNVTSEGVDIGNIPLSLIERVEILRDGASPIYGADAIGGVINFVLKRNFDGAEISGEAGTSTYGDGVTWDLGGLIGRNFANGNVTLGVEHASSGPILQRNRSWSRSMVDDIEPNGSLTVNRNLGGFAIFSSPFTDPRTGRRGSKWTADGNGQYHLSTVADRLDLSAFSQLNIAQDRTSIALMSHFAVADEIELYGSFLFTDRQSGTLGTPPSLGITPVTLKYPTGFVVPATALGNPFGRSLTLSKSLVQLGPTQGAVESDTYQLQGGARGRLADRFDWDLSYRYGDSQSSFETRNALNFTHAEQLAGNVPCSAADAANGCGPADFFGPYSLSAAAVNYLRYAARNTSDYTQQEAAGTVSGPLFDLPAGPLKGAVGADYRKLSGSYMPDALTLAGDQSSADATPTKGGYDVAEAFAEIRVPLIANLVGFKELDVTGAARQSHYSDFGNATTWKAALDWQVNDDLRLRASRSTGFRAPSITELFLGRTTTSPAFNDPCDSHIGLTGNPVVRANCSGQGVPSNFTQPTNNYPVIQGGNPGLKPETSQNWSAGLVLTALPGLTVNADYWHVLIRNAITVPNLSDIVNACYQSPGLSDPLCRLIGPRNPTLASLTNVTALFANVGEVHTDGVDAEADYALELGDGGRLLMTDQAEFTFSDRQQTRPGGIYNQYAGTVDQPTSATNPGAVPKFRDTASLAYSRGDWSVQWTTRYIGSVWAYGLPRITNSNHTHEIYYHDIAGWIDLGRYHFVVGIDNLTNAKPPFYDDGTVNTSQYTYDVVGRFFYAKFRIEL